MTISLQSRFWKFTFSKFYKGRRMTIPVLRAQGDNLSKFMGRLPNDIQIENIDIDGIRAAWIRPSNADDKKVLLHLHGGGYVTGSIKSYLMMSIPMAQTLKMNVLFPEYRLAPENPFPAAIDDVLKIYRWLLTQGYQSKDIIISGDSAGGGLCIASVVRLREENEALPAALVCMSPWMDFTMQGKSYISNSTSEAMLTTNGLREWALNYTSEQNFGNPLVSPVFADLQKFPPMLIQVSADEILFDDAIALAEKAKADGVDVTLKIWDGMWHVWQVLGDLIPESRAAFEEINQFLQEHTHKSL